MVHESPPSSSGVMLAEEAIAETSFPAHVAACWGTGPTRGDDAENSRTAIVLVSGVAVVVVAVAVVGVVIGVVGPGFAHWVS